jgi:8-oxo-dGTP pyrophosphatase MutT (NUDIX family)
MAMKKFYVGVKAIIREERGVLLVHSKKGYWDVPGGRIDGDETYEQTLAREISEEIIGAELTRAGKLLSSTRMPFDVDEDTGLVLIFLLAEANVPEKIVLCDEMDDYLWVKTKNDIPIEGLKEDIRSGIEAALAQKYVITQNLCNTE